jgi:hypothetical protein
MSDTAGSDVEPIVDILEACICMLLIKGYWLPLNTFKSKCVEVLSNSLPVMNCP